MVAKKLSSILDNLPVPDTEVLILGDFNFPHVNWNSLEMQGATTEDKCQARQLLGIVKAKY